MPDKIDAFLDDDSGIDAFLDAPAAETELDSPTLIKAFRQILGIPIQQVAGPELGVLQGAGQFATGFGRGLVRKPTPEGAGSLFDPLAAPERLGESLGRVAGPVAGGALATLAAPAVLPAVPFGATAALVGAGAAGVGAAGGDLAQSGLAKAAGGEAPESMRQAIGQAVKIGLIAAGTDLGFGAIIGTVKAVAPTIVDTFAKIPSESIKRAILKPEIVKLGSEAKKGVGLRAVVYLRQTQKAVEATRTELGQSVNNALQGFEKAVNGKPVIDVSKAGQYAADVIHESRAGVEAVAEALPKAELDHIYAISAKIAEKPNMTPTEAVALRRAIDDLTAFKKGGTQQVSSDVGERAAKAMGRGLREAIEDAAKQARYKPLMEANAKFHNFATVYDEISGEIGTKAVTPRALLDQVQKKIAPRFNEGGYSQAIIEGIARQAPKAGRALTGLLDNVAALELTKLPKGTPSGTILNVLRLFMSPQGVGAGIKAISPAEKAVRLAAPAIGSTSARSNQEGR